MINISYTADERETILNCNDEDYVWNICTLQTKVITRLKKVNILPDRVDSDGMHYFSNIPFNQVSFRGKSTRTMSDENKAKAAERMSKVREAKKSE